MATGLDPLTGRALSGRAWLRAAIVDVLTTPVGTRVMRRDYGSRLFDLLDQPLNPVTRQRVYAATAEALRRWLPGVFRLTRARLVVDPARLGAARLQLEGVDLTTPTPAPLRFRVPLPLWPAAASAVA